MRRLEPALSRLKLADSPAKGSLTVMSSKQFLTANQPAYTITSTCKARGCDAAEVELLSGDEPNKARLGGWFGHSARQVGQASKSMIREELTNEALRFATVSTGVQSHRAQKSSWHRVRNATDRSRQGRSARAQVRRHE